LEGRGSGLIEVLYQNLTGLRKTTRILSQDSQCPGIRKFYILFSTNFPYSYAGGKIGHIFTEVLFGKFAFPWYDAPMLVEWIDFTMQHCIV
jgi:hypothetical protein